MARDQLPSLNYDEAAAEILMGDRRKAEVQEAARTRAARPRMPPAFSGRPDPVGGAHYGSLYAPPPADLAELRRRQAEFALTQRELDRQNSWMAVPALAPAVTVGALEAAVALAARLAAPTALSGPLVLTKRMPYRQVGDNWSTRIGRRADKHYKDLARLKDGYRPGPRVIDSDGRTLIPDIGTPPRTADPDVIDYIEVKPNTPSGRAAAARQMKRYREATERRVKPLFYDPERFK